MSQKKKFGSIVKHGFFGLLGAASLVYLCNPTAGVFEFLPDNLPFVGNVDEATATAVLLASLAHFGFDLGGWLERLGLRPKSPRKPVDAVTHESNETCESTETKLA